jgi:predicted nucleotide-binding protein
MKLKELKARVYELAEVATTQQLKAKYPEVRTLDMRLKISWETALCVVQPPNQFKEWLDNPPDEYKDLFAEIAQVSQDYDSKRATTKQLSKEVVLMSSDLDALAEEVQDEADHLKQDIKITAQMAKQAELN